MDLLECALDSSIHQIVIMDEVQFTVVASSGTTDAVVIVRQLQKYITAANKKLYFPSATLRKRFFCVTRRVLLWALGGLGVDEWAVLVIEGMCHNARSRVRVNGPYNEEFGLGVGFHQHSVLSLLLIIPV